MGKQHFSTSENYDSASGKSIIENLHKQLDRYPDRCRHKHRKHIKKHIWKNRCFDDYDNWGRKVPRKQRWSDVVTYSVSYSYEIPRHDFLSRKSNKYHMMANQMRDRMIQNFNPGSQNYNYRGYPRTRRSKGSRKNRY